MSQHGVVLFYGIQGALRAEKVMQNAELIVKLVPTPRQLSSDCGVALRFDWDSLDQVQKELSTCSVEFDTIYPLE